MADDRTYITRERANDSNSAAWALAIVAVVIVLVGAFLLFYRGNTFIPITPDTGGTAQTPDVTNNYVTVPNTNVNGSTTTP